jgi:hypothetical protein
VKIKEEKTVLTKVKLKMCPVRRFMTQFVAEMKKPMLTLA